MARRGTAASCDRPWHAPIRDGAHTLSNPGGDCVCGVQAGEATHLASAPVLPEGAWLQTPDLLHTKPYDLAPLTAACNAVHAAFSSCPAARCGLPALLTVKHSVF